jgi:CubicO group peptidase (beta-lactamase class C family)
MNQTLTHAIVASALVFTSYAVASVEPDYSEIVAKQVAPAIEAGLFPGAVIGIYKDGEASFYPVGTLNFDTDEAPTIDTLYEIGSISKVFTGVLFADAVRRGEVSRDTLVDDLLPDGYKVKTKEGEDLKLWHLTTHTSGWATAPVNLAPADGEKPFTGYTQEMIFEAVNLMPLKQAPGTKMEYSNFAVGLLGTLISINAHGEYESLAKERIIEPLGIENFTIALDEDQQKRLAPATASGRQTKAWGKTGPIDPAGMWVTNAPGLLKFATANLTEHEGEVYESLTLAREPLFDLGNGGKICSGWFRAGDGSTYWHNGMTGGYSSYMAVNPRFGAAVVILTNGASFQTTAVGEKIIQSLFGMNPDPIKIEKIEKLDTAYSDRLIGIYHSALGFDMTITVTKGRLFAQLTGQQALGLAKIGDDRFKIAMVEAELQFDLPEEGDAKSVTLFQNGREIKCERKE